MLQMETQQLFFIARDIVRSIDTSGMWIDVISTSGYKNEFDKWDFQV